MRLLIAPIVLPLATAALLAQDYRVEVRLVEMEVRVTDRDGKPVADLTRADFTLKEDDVAHDIATVQFVPFVESLRVAAPDGATSEEAVPSLPVAPTWVYVATEVTATDVPRTQKALRTFVLGGLGPGFKVSIAGQPFTDDRTQLLDTLSRLSRAPLGKHGLTGLVDLERLLADEAAGERALAATSRRQNEGTAPMAGFPTRPEPMITDASQARPVTEGGIDRQLSVYGDLALQHYFDLVEKMAALPGKKAIVLMRAGLRMELANAGLFQDLASFAVRRRVSFYTVDSRGLDASPPVDDRPMSLMDTRRRPEPDLFGQAEMRALAREGLENLAHETGGKALIGTNRLADVFDRVVADASGYYVLSYYPIDLSTSGRFRSVKIVVNRPGVKIQQTARGYYEPRPTSMFSKDDRGLSLRRAMQLPQPPNELPVAASAAFFADARGFPVFVLSAGVPASALEPDKPGHKPLLSAMAIVRIADAEHTRLPMYFERRLEAPLGPGALARVKADPTAFLAMTDLLSLLPGEYDWRVVFRDERTGRLGGMGGRVRLKDFRGPSTASTMLLTRQVTRADAGVAGDKEAAQPLDAGTLRYTPQCSPVFRRGETVHLLYTLYNATASELDAAKRGMQVAVIHDGHPVKPLDAFGEPFVDTQRALIQFTGSINTSGLEAGAYTVIGMLPDFEHRAQKSVEQRFVLLGE
jgi:VWFA-related protein